MSENTARSKNAARTRSIAFCGLTVALMAVSAWVSVPLGPVPFTLQTFAMVFALIALTPKQCIASIACYLAIGTIGIPVFASMRSGIGVILGPTGGFLWGWLVGALVALALMAVLTKRDEKQSAPRASKSSRREIAVSFAGAVVFIVVMYLAGWLQFMVVTGSGPAAAFAAAVGPFIIVDAIKTVLGVFTALAVKRAVR